jgi:hypothetical protein
MARLDGVLVTGISGLVCFGLGCGMIYHVSIIFSLCIFICLLSHPPCYIIPLYLYNIRCILPLCVIFFSLSQSLPIVYDRKK